MGKKTLKSRNEIKLHNNDFFHHIPRLVNCSSHGFGNFEFPSSKMVLTKKQIKNNQESEKASEFYFITFKLHPSEQLERKNL